jgi:hypothetical protein
MQRKDRITRHKLPTCGATGLVRYRDRHQARQGAAAQRTTTRQIRLATFACPECRGFHLEALRQHSPYAVESAAESVATPEAAPRRYVLVDIENLTAGNATRKEVKALWDILAQKSPGMTTKDHVVVGANRYVAKKFSTTIVGSNIKWVVGAEGPDGADRALLAACNLHQIAKTCSELIIMSGDHAFTELALRAKKLGLRTHVVTTKRMDGSSSLSRGLAAAADVTTIVLLQYAHPPTAPTAATPAA